MRDLDIFVVANQEVTESFVEKIGAHIECVQFGYFSRKDLQSRPHVPLDKPVLTRNHYVAGLVYIGFRTNGEILDLSVYHTKDELDLNGIFDIDSVQTLLPDCEQLPYDLPLLHLENPEDSVKDKLQRAMALGKFPLIVIEQFIKIKALSNHFIPLSDFTLQSLGAQNLAQLIEFHKNPEGALLTIVAYVDEDNTVQMHQEKLKGEIAT